MRQMRRGCYRILIALASPVIAIGQPVRGIPDAPSCATCRIVASKIGTITHEIESAERVANGHAVMDGRGRIYMESDWRRWQLDVFDSTGRFLRKIGGRGNGPGEFSRIRQIVIGRGDSVHVIDDANARQSVISPSSLAVVRESAWRTGGTLLGMRPFGDRRFIAANSGVDLRPGGHVLRILNDSGAVLREFDAGRDSTRRQSWFETYRVISPDGSGGVYAAHTFEYRIDHWNSDGRLIDVRARTVPWFRPLEGGQSKLLPAEGDWPAIRAITMDANGLLWIMVIVRDSQWKNALTDERDERGRAVRTVGDLNGYDDTIIEVLDPRSGRLLASRRFAESFLRFLKPGYVMSASDEPEPSVTIWRLSLEGR